MPDTNIKSKVIDEAAEYLKISREMVVREIETMKSELHKIWNSNRPQTIEELKKFYNEQPLHFFNVLDFNTWSDAQYPKVNLIEYGIKTAVDFGCGCGTTAVYLSDLGIQTDVAELSEPLRKFAVWRLRKRGYTTNEVSLANMMPLKKKYDLVTCIDVLEHLINPLEMVYHFAQHAKYFYATALKPQDMSQHLNLWPREKVIDIFIDLGWKPIWLAQDEGRGFFESA